MASLFLHFSWDAVVATTSDASLFQEQERIDGVTENLKSQLACITALALDNALNAEKMLIHPLSWSWTRVRRVCRGALMAEAYALSNAVEHGLRTRAIIVDMRGRLNIGQWDKTASAAMGHVCFTDCGCLFCTLDFSQYQTSRQQTSSDRVVCVEPTHLGRVVCDEEVDGSKGDYPRWIDTSRMLSDCSTMTMTSGQLNETLSTDIFDMRPTEESLAIQAKSRK